jgi:acid stress-induced BolA-like protein IbaG/YrbA
MNESEIRQLLEAGLGKSEIKMQSDGNKLMLLISAAAFAGLGRVKRQQLVYDLLKEKITSGEIHAVSMKCLAPDEQLDR